MASAPVPQAIVFAMMVAAYVGSAGYVTAHAAKVWGWPPELAILAGVAGAAALGLVIGALAIRRQGIYFAMITLALAQMLYFFCLQAPFTGGEDGIQSVPRGLLFGLVDLRNTLTMYFTVLAIFLAGFLLIYRTIHSPFGQVLKAIRENEPRAWVTVVQGAIFVLCVLAFRRGVVGELARLLKKPL